jgi:hypothetical protein
MRNVPQPATAGTSASKGARTSASNVVRWASQNALVLSTSRAW